VDRLLYYARPKPPQRKRVRLHTIIEDSLSFFWRAPCGAAWSSISPSTRAR
jgi:hypothetical protein